MQFGISYFLAWKMLGDLCVYDILKGKHVRFCCVIDTFNLNIGLNIWWSQLFHTLGLIVAVISRIIFVFPNMKAVIAS